MITEESIEKYDIVDVLIDHDYLLNPCQLTEFTKHIVVYIAGFIVYFLNKRIDCTECLALRECEEVSVMTLISQKSRGGLKHPSKLVIDLCLTTERYLKCQIEVDGEISI